MDVVLRDQRVKPAMTKLDYVLVRNVILMRNVTNARVVTMDTLIVKVDYIFKTTKSTCGRALSKLRIGALTTLNFIGACSPKVYL